jgi:hypothetical protein
MMRINSVFSGWAVSLAFSAIGILVMPDAIQAVCDDLCPPPPPIYCGEFACTYMNWVWDHWDPECTNNWCQEQYCDYKVRQYEGVCQESWPSCGGYSQFKCV